MNLDQFIEKYEGETVGYPEGKYVGECLSLCKVYIKEVFGIDPPPSGSNSAYGYWSNFPNPLGEVFVKIPDANGIVPVPGDIVIWNTNVADGFGHIDICLSASLDSRYFEGFDQNWNGKSAHKVNHNYNNVVGYLHPKENMPTQSELDTCLKDRLKFWDERDLLLKELTSTEVEGGLNTIRGYRARITDLTNQLGTSQAEVKNREEQIGRFRADMLTMAGQIEELTRQVKLKQDEVNKFASEKGALAIEVGKLQVQVETLTQQVQEGSVTLTWGDLFQLLLQQKITIKKK